MPLGSRSVRPGAAEEALVNDRLSRLESEVQSLSRALERVEDRLGSLEKRAGTQASVGTEPVATPAPVPSDSEVATGITFAGRTLLVLGGGYLLRALTESGALPPMAGVTLGLTYALLWLLAADRAAHDADGTAQAARETTCPGRSRRSLRGGHRPALYRGWRRSEAAEFRQEPIMA